MTTSRGNVNGAQKVLRVVTPEMPVRTGLAKEIAEDKSRRKWSKTDKRYILRVLKYIVFTAIVLYFLSKINL